MRELARSTTCLRKFIPCPIFVGARPGGHGKHFDTILIVRKFSVMVHPARLQLLGTPQHGQSEASVAFLFARFVGLFVLEVEFSTCWGPFAGMIVGHEDGART